MTIYDGLMLGLVVAGMIWGAWRGVTWQVASIASLVLGYLVAVPAAGPLSKHFPGNDTVSWGLALAATYVAVSGGVFLAAWSIRTTLRRLKFEAYDRHLGMILGGLEGALVGVVATVVVVSLAPSTRDPVRASAAGRVVGKTLAVAESALPESVRDALGPFWRMAESDGLVAGVPPLRQFEEEVARDLRALRPADTGAGDGSVLGDVLEEGGARIGRALSDAVERGDRGDGRDPRRRR